MAVRTFNRAALCCVSARAAAVAPNWDARWRYRSEPGEPWRLKKRRLGLAWQEPDSSGKWRKRRGRCPEGWLDERAANLAAVAAMDDHARGLERDRAAAAQRELTVRSIAEEWLGWLEQVRGAKPSTVADYRFLLREPGTQHRRGPRLSAGRIMAAFGDRHGRAVSTAEISRFLRPLDRAG